MALTWDLTGIRDFEKLVDDDGGPGPVTRALIWHQMTAHVGGEITDRNCDQVFVRIWIWERCLGAMLMEDDGGLRERPITLADVRRHVGLRTNCFGSEGKRHFKEHVMSTLFHKAAAELARQVRDYDNAVSELSRESDNA